MVSSILIQLFIYSLLTLISLSKPQSAPKPKALLLPVSKDPSTLQYLTQLSLGTPLVSRSFVIDLGGRYLWMECETGYNSSTYRPGRCGTAPCSVGKANGCFNCNSSPKPGCNNNTCSLAPENTITKFVSYEELAVDVISLRSTDGTTAGGATTVPNYIFACSRSWLLDGLAVGSKGMAGFGRTKIGIATQLSFLFGGNLRPKFALCLPPTSNPNGVIFFGSSSYIFNPTNYKSKPINVGQRLSYTKLYINPFSTANAYIKGEPSTEYFIGVNSVMIDRKPISVNKTLLSFNRRGYGGTKISTVNPYTVLESSIYKAVTGAFAKELKAMNVDKVAAVAPFTECFSTEFLSYTQMGPGVPDIQLVLENKQTYWDISSPNLMVEINRNVLCLAFLDGGVNPRTSIVIGAHQLENNLLEFDLAASRLGFTSTLLLAEVECANFKI